MPQKDQSTELPEINKENKDAAGIIFFFTKI